MSYILDALRKAERERVRGRVPSLATVDFELAESRRIWPWFAGAVALAVGAALSAWLWMPGLLATSRPPAVDVPTAAAPVIPESQAPTPPPAKPRPEVKPARPPVAEARPGAKAAPLPRAAPGLPPAAEPAPVPSALIGPAEHLAPVRPKAETGGAKDMAHESAWDAAPAESAPNLRPPVPPRPVGAAPHAAPAPSAPPKATAAPAPQLQQAVSKMTLNVLVYSEAKSDRMVYIDGRPYVEGQKVQGRYLVESITPDGAVLSASGERVVLPAQPNPSRGP